MISPGEEAAGIASGEPFDVIIGGASFAGLALARALVLSLGPELRIALVDRAGFAEAPGAAGDSRASHLSAATQHMLTALGIWTELAAAAQPVTRIEISDSGLDDGIRSNVLSWDNVLPPGEPASYIVPNRTVLQALHRSVAADASVTRIQGGVRKFSADDAEARVSLEDGRILHGRLVVAADGRRSALREAAGIKITTSHPGQTGLVTTIAHERPHGGVAIQHFLPAGPFAILPLKGNFSCITWSEANASASTYLAMDDGQFLDALDQRIGGRLGTISLAGPRQSWPIELHLARRYVAPRFAVIGDAAHGVHPIAGQGLNLALKDAAALAEVVADTLRLGLDIGSLTLLARYERWRRFDSTMAAFAFSGLNQLFSFDGTVARAVRQAGLGVLDRMPGLKPALVSEGAGLTGELPRLLRGERV